MTRPAEVGWWRRNAVALVALLILAPVTVGVIAVNEWSQYDQGTATKPITVAAGEAVGFADSRIGPVTAEFTDNVAAPADTRVVRAVMLVWPGGGPISCAVPMLRETGGQQRQWSVASSYLDLPYDPESHGTCDSERPIRYALTLDYLVPEDADGPFTVDFVSNEVLPQYLEFIIEP